MPKVSVIVPTYNSAHFLSDCMDSLLAQTLQDFEVVVVDDASIDNTEEVVNRYRDRFLARLKYLRLEKRVGRGEIRNHGIKQARGEYLAFVDADDVYLPDKLEIQSEHIDGHPMIGGVSCKYYYANAGLEVQELGRSEDCYLRTLFGSQYGNFEVNTVSLMLRRDVIDKVGMFDRRITRGQDLDFIIRVIRHYQIDFIPVPLYIYRLHENNSGSFHALKERTISNMIICRNILDSESISGKGRARRFVLNYLSSHVYRIRERDHFTSIRVWFLYLWKMNFNLPLVAWCQVGTKAIVGYRLTKAIKSLLRVG